MASLVDAATGAAATLEAVDDLLAIQGPPRPDWGEAAPLESVVELENERGALAAAGWSFVRPAPGTMALYRNGMEPTDAVAIGRVYRCGRQVLVATRHLVIGLDDGMDEAAVAGFLAGHGLLQERRFQTAPNMIRVRLGTDDPFEAAEHLAAAEEVLWAEPDPVFTPQERFTPTDPLYSQQWHHGIMGCEHAWAVTRGAGIRIGIIDTSFDISHPDLKAGILPASVQRLQDGTWVSAPNWQFPGGSHGTECAGVAGARVNNGVGGCGVAPDAGLLLVAIGTWPIPSSAFAEAFYMAYHARSDVVASSVSQGGIPLSNGLKCAIDRLVRYGRKRLGVPVFWAVPNSNIPLSGDPVASYPPVIAVGASRPVIPVGDAPVAAAFGPALDFLAPGVSIVTTSPGNIYASQGGTSMAAPGAAAVGALVLAAHPKLTGRAVRRILRTTCDKIGPLPYGIRTERNTTCGWGRIHAGGAVLRAAYLASRPAPG